MVAHVTPHPNGGLIVQAWYPQQATGAAPHTAAARPADTGPHASVMTGPGLVPDAAPAPARRPSAFVRLMRFAASERKGFNVVGIVYALVVAAPVYTIAWYTRFEPLAAFAITSTLAVVLTVGSAWVAKVKGFKVFSAAFLAALTGFVPMVHFLDAADALVVVDNRGGKSLYVFADGERIAKVAAGTYEIVGVDIRTEKVGWGRSKSKPKTKKTVSFEEGDRYLLDPKGGRCYLVVTTSYSLTGLGEPANDAVEWLPDKVWQKLSPAPYVEFADNPGTLTTDLGASNPVSRALRRSLACSKLARCPASDKKALEACYSAAKGEDDFKACGDDAEERCAPRPGDG